MKKFFLSMLALASMAGVACAQEVVATIDYSKLREYPYVASDQGFDLELNGGVLTLTNGTGWPQCTIINNVPLVANETYTISVAMKGDKNGACAIVAGNWGAAWNNSAEPLKFTTKWEVCSTTITPVDKEGDNGPELVAESNMVRFQPNNYADVMEVAWVVVSKGDAEPETTPLMPVDLDNAEEVAYVNFGEFESYTYECADAELVDGVLVSTGDGFFNVMEDLQLEPELDYGIVAKIKASADVEVGVSMGDWGIVTDGTCFATEDWSQVVVRLGLAPVNEDGNLLPKNFVMFTPVTPEDEEAYAGTIEVEWVKLVYFLPPVEEPEPVYETKWSMVLDDLTGEDGPCENVYARIGEVGEWQDVEAGVCEGPGDVGKVFYADVQAHPLYDGEGDDPIPDHHTQFFVQYPDNKFKSGDIMKVSFDYYSTVERRVDTQSHFTAGEYILWHFIGTFTAKPEWQNFTAEVEITDEMVGSFEEQGCIAFNLATKDDDEGKPESIFYMNHITIEKGEQVLVSGEEPVLEWQSIITNGNANDGSSVNVLARVDGNDSEAAVVDNPAGEGKVFEAPIVAKTDGIEDWTSQMFIEFNQALEEGTKIKVSFDYYSSNERTVQTQAHGTPGNYHWYDMLGNLEAKPEWQSIEKEVTITADQAGADGCKAIAFNLSTSEEAGTFYINNVVVEALLEAGSGDTAVEEIEVAPAAGVESSRIVVYNLLGVKVLDTDDASQLNTLKKGIYIVNGKKVAL